MTKQHRQEKNSKRALLLYGGWEGHQPELFANFSKDHLLREFEVVCSQDLDMLHPRVLAGFDLLVPIWTFGELTEEQVTHLLNAVANDGLGMVAWHGIASAFLNSRSQKFLLGGQFVGHPGGNNVKYDVRFLDNDELVEGLENITVVSERYYLLVDPSIKVLATTTFEDDEMYWLNGVQVPVAWKRTWGKGRVFYCSLGHTLDVIAHPTVKNLLRRAVYWAADLTEKVPPR